MTDTQTIDRVEAARILRAARRANPQQEGELVEWAHSLLPDSRMAARLKIQYLLKKGNTQAAGSMIARWRLLRPSDSSFALLQAQCAMKQGQLEIADRELRLLIQNRPHHVASLRLAARIAQQLNQQPRAIRYLEQAVKLQPERQNLKCELVEALIQAECLVRAEVVLHTIIPIPASHLARLLQAQGRLLDAADVLEKAVGKASDAQEQDALLVQLLDLLEVIGNVNRLRAVIDHISPQHHRAQLRIGRILLSLSDYAACLTRVQRLARFPQFRQEALHILIVAAAYCNRHSLGLEALHELSLTKQGIDKELMADCWLRACHGQLICRSRGARQSGSDPSLKLLSKLAQDALAVFESDLRRPLPPLTPEEHKKLENYRNQCLLALGHPTAANSTIQHQSPDSEITETRQAA